MPVVLEKKLLAKQLKALRREHRSATSRQPKPGMDGWRPERAPLISSAEHDHEAAECAAAQFWEIDWFSTYHADSAPMLQAVLAQAHIPGAAQPIYLLHRTSRSIYLHRMPTIESASTRSLKLALWEQLESGGCSRAGGSMVGGLPG